MIFSKAATLSAALVSVAKALATNVNSENYSTLEVDAAPDFVRPYVLRHYANSHAVSIGAQVYRFQVTGPSSDYAFTLMSTNAPESGYLGVLPHIHEHHYENFFNYRGRFQLWAEKNGEENARSLTSGDYGAVPPNITHTFQILDPDTEMVGVIVPGGFESVHSLLI
jgi:quercetin dioxygenase-like cupin family protein